ncbi:hypothetical protein [Peptoniphilus sp. oral taxon 386]|uniref:hypothetical protein n=1 Tax=Peptoniphilus sp. oral taxon 386 TaxID=652713 RepID=UPI0001DA9A58|nr:hypothetical protein [Peptoniphilus sp. oral taxon 386]EFI41906.1 hypothetical protein HMPREF0629_00535 [Peptoniphilus sp. oral taxon 386 str. F0131]
MKFTNMEKLYLLHLIENKNQNTITSVASAFNCTKPNSKKILDKMLNDGVLCKEENRYMLTKKGNDFAEKFNKNRINIEKFLNILLNLEEDKIKELSYKLMGNELDILNEILAEKSKKMLKFKSTNVDYNELINILGGGEYNAYLSIDKIEDELKNSSIETSMAMMGFESNVRIVVGEESYILLTPKEVKKASDGFIRSGFVMDISYFKNGVEEDVVYNEKNFLIPLYVFKNWKLINKKILYSSSYLKISSKIGFSKNHNKKAIFNIFIDLVNL